MVNGFGNASMDFNGKFKKRRPDVKKPELRNPVFMRVCGFENGFDHFLTTKKPESVGINRK